MLELAVLGILKEQELHGYELKKRVSEALGPWSRVSFGSLYPALSRLEKSGAISVIDDEPDVDPVPAVIPMTGSLSGEAAAYRTHRPGARRGTARSTRSRKCYRITDRGEELFTELLATDAGGGDDDRLFSLKLAFCRYLPPDARLRLLERRRAQLIERLAQVQETIRSKRGRIDQYVRSLMEHGTEATERDISWLDRLIATERQEGQAS